MEAAGLLAAQIAVMFLYMAAGWTLFHAGTLSREGSANVAGLLVWLVIPAVIVRSFCVPCTPERWEGFWWSAGGALVALALSSVLARVLFRRDGIDAFAAAYSNAGFIGIPLVRATLGTDAVFYLATFIAVLNVLQWTLGVAWIRERRLAFDRSLLVHPIVLATVLGILLFVSGGGAYVPPLALTALDGVAGLNAPLAMVVLGGYLARSHVRELVTDVRAWLVSMVRLILIPLGTVVAFRLIGLPPAITAALLIAAAAPVGVNVAVYAELYGRDAMRASRGVVLSTLLSCVSMPLLLAACTL